MGWTVHKFGGTSVADARCFDNVAEIVTTEGDGNVAIVVSAMKGMTDQLLGLIDRAAHREPVDETLRELRERYTTAVNTLLDGTRAQAVQAAFEQVLEKYRTRDADRWTTKDIPDD